MEKNSFRELEQLNESRFDEKRTRENVQHSMGLFQFFGNIVELFVPKIFSIFVNMTGGKSDDETNGNFKQNHRPKYPNKID